MKLSVIITAGGMGKRFSSEVPKQFLALEGIPVLMHSINAFNRWNPNTEIVLTLPEEWFDYWKELIDKYNFRTPHSVVGGGKERYHSIKNALSSCSGDLVMIHDGVRPLVDENTLDRCLNALQKNKAVVPYIKLKDSIRSLNGNKSISVVRKNFVSVQTPQCFEFNVINDAYQGEYQDFYTDDASVAEKNGIEIHLVEGNEENIKITTPVDLKVAHLLIKKAE